MHGDTKTLQDEKAKKIVDTRNRLRFRACPRNCSYFTGKHQKNELKATGKIANHKACTNPINYMYSTNTMILILYMPTLPERYLIFIGKNYLNDILFVVI